MRLVGIIAVAAIALLLWSAAIGAITYKLIQYEETRAQVIELSKTQPQIVNWINEQIKKDQLNASAAGHGSTTSHN